ncbi:MAG: hypothetical protein KBT36_01450 [Kurthia sp.]|nr:hypothetical protein [Candidatus Kurthia equi]
MIALEERQLVYEYLMMDIAIRSLQYDIEHIQGLKYAELYVQQLSAVLTYLQRDFQWRKSTLASKKIRLVKWVKVNEQFSDAVLTTTGEDATIRFSALVLKQNSQLLISQKLLPISEI